jgi:hypothetical protein
MNCRSRAKARRGNTFKTHNEPRCKRCIKRTRLELIRRFLDKNFPEVGVDCPSFPVMVVLFSAAVLRTTTVECLCHFTGYGREYVQALAENMANNRLWQGDQYLALGWLRDGCLDENEFGRQIDVALGTLCYSREAAASGRRRDLLEFNSAYAETI